MPHLLYIAIGFPPAAKSCAYRMRATANLFAERGWDVTVLTVHDHAWELEYGLDHTLTEGVHERVTAVKLPLHRTDLDPDVTRYSRFRARFPDRWVRTRFARDQIRFPEKVFGSWRPALEQGALDVHGARPVDLTLVSPAPYTALAAAWSLKERHDVPYVVDFRDAWSLDVLAGRPAFGPHGRRGRWEKRVVDGALETWTVNEAIRQHYVDRYPEATDRLHVVRNGFDPVQGLPVPVRERGPDDPLVFGYLGTLNLDRAQTRTMLEAWRWARRADDRLKTARLVFRGHVGMGMARGANSNATLIHQYRIHGVGYGGPVHKAETARAYAQFDVMVLALAGGRYVTSGKVYEYMATGLPIVGVHEADHASSEVLRGYPLHDSSRSLVRQDITDAFVRAGRMALEATPRQREAAAGHAAQFTRERAVGPAVDRVIAAVGRRQEVTS